MKDCCDYFEDPHWEQTDEEEPLEAPIHPRIVARDTLLDSRGKRNTTAQVMTRLGRGYTWERP